MRPIEAHLWLGRRCAIRALERRAEFGWVRVSLQKPAKGPLEYAPKVKLSPRSVCAMHACLGLSRRMSSATCLAALQMGHVPLSRRFRAKSSAGLACWDFAQTGRGRPGWSLPEKTAASSSA